MELFLLRSARWRYWMLLAAAFGFTATGVLLLVVEKTSAGRFIAVVLILFFGAAAAVFARELFDGRPRIKIDGFGVEDRTLGVGIIPWSEIASAYRMDVQGHPFICLVLRDPKPWVEKVSWAKRAMMKGNRALGCTEFNLNLSGIDAEPEQVYELVLKLASADRRASSCKPES